MLLTVCDKIIETYILHLTQLKAYGIGRNNQLKSKSNLNFKIFILVSTHPVKVQLSSSQIKVEAVEIYILTWK